MKLRNLGEKINILYENLNFILKKNVFLQKKITRWISHSPDVCFKYIELIDTSVNISSFLMIIKPIISLDKKEKL